MKDIENYGISLSEWLIINYPEIIREYQEKYEINNEFIIRE